MSTITLHAGSDVIQFQVQESPAKITGALRRAGVNNNPAILLRHENGKPVTVAVRYFVAAVEE